MDLVLLSIHVSGNVSLDSVSVGHSLVELGDGRQAGDHFSSAWQFMEHCQGSVQGKISVANLFVVKQI